MKKIVIFLLIGCGIIGACSKNEATDLQPMIQEIVLSEETIEIGVNQIKEIAVSGGNNKDFQAQTSSENIEIGQHQKSISIKGMKVGEGVVVVSSAGVSKTLKVKVVKHDVEKQNVLVKDIIVENQLRFQAGQRHVIPIEIVPSNADNQNLIIESADKSIIGIPAGSQGEIYVFNKSGKPTIVTIKTTDGSNIVKQVTIIPVQLTKKITITQAGERGNIQLKASVGSKMNLQASVEPENATDKHIIWQSSHSDIVSVSENGQIQWLKEGTATISAIPRDGAAEPATLQVKSVLGITKLTIDNVPDKTLKVSQGTKVSMSATTWHQEQKIEEGIQKKSKISHYGTLTWRVKNDSYFFGNNGDDYQFDAYKKGSFVVEAMYYDALDEQSVHSETITIIVE